MPPVSVIICTHNPRKDYLSQVLDALRRQSLPLAQWELLLVDNGSDTSLDQAWDLSWHSHARHIRENQPGVSMARRRGIREAKGDLIVFVDDDNVLEHHYLEIALTLAGEWPNVGVFGGSQIPEYECELGDDIKEHVDLIAIRAIPKVLWTNIKGVDQATPRGAGMCIRRDIALNYARQVEGNPLRKMVGRFGSLGISGEDTDMAWCACDEGYGMLVTPALVLRHLISKSRLNKSYFIKIYEGHAVSGVLLAHIHNLPRSKSRLVDSAREILRILQAPRLFHKRLLIAGLLARRRGYKILSENAKGRGSI